MENRINECQAAVEIIEAAQGISKCSWDELTKSLALVKSHWGQIPCEIKAKMAQKNIAFKLQAYVSVDLTGQEELSASIIDSLMPVDSMGFATFDGMNPTMHAAIQEHLALINENFDENLMDAAADATAEEAPYRTICKDSFWGRLITGHGQST